MNPLDNSSSSKHIALNNHGEIISPQPSTEENTIPLKDAADTNKKEWPEDKLSISAEGKKKLEEEEESKTPQELAEELKQKTIDNIKERLEQLREELKKLEGQTDEASLETAKLLQGQINDLNGQLLTIMTS